MKKYDMIYSLGRDCSCAMYMQRYNLRLWSGPFDWLTNASFETRMELITNDFADFMNLEDIEFLPKDPKVFNDKDCDYYKNTRNDFYYYHDFPIGVPLAKSFPAVRDKYMRRIKRFYKNISEHRRVLLIYFSHYSSTPDDVVKQLCDKFCKKMNKEVDFLIIEHTDGLNVARVRDIAKNITRYDVHTMQLDENGNPTTLGNEANCNPIFAGYGIRKNLKENVHSGIQWLLRHMVYLFVPNRQLRHKLCNYISERL